jgi:thioredoxin reductase
MTSMSQAYDVVIVGGGAAGLSAALILGRCLRNVLVCDDGHPRNEASSAAHCLLGNEGIVPADLLAKGQRELRAYETVVIRKGKVTSVTSEQRGFMVAGETGFIATARKVLLTTGLKDQVPEIDGIKRFYGRSVHHCPYCEGFENRDRPIAVYGKGDKGAGFALMMKQWTRDVILCTDGRSDVSMEMQTRLKQQAIKVLPGKIVKLKGNHDGELQRIIFVGGEARLQAGRKGRHR